MKTLELPEWMLFQSFRYCLGRASSSVSNFCDWMKDNLDLLSEEEKIQMKKEIDYAIDHGLAGHDIDVECWNNLRRLL